VPEEAYLLAEPLVAALNVAVAKARQVAAAGQQPDEVTLAADTLVVADGRILGKPADAHEAAGMLHALAGRAHSVLTGVALSGQDGSAWGGVVSTSVVMRAVTDAEIRAYVGRGEPFDKAGGYAIQDTIFRPVERLEGCYLNVVGLPLCAVAAGLEALGVAVERPRSMQPPCTYCQLGAERVAVA
jgi:MAF protein